MDLSISSQATVVASVSGVEGRLAGFNCKNVCPIISCTIFQRFGSQSQSPMIHETTVSMTEVNKYASCDLCSFAILTGPPVQMTDTPEIVTDERL
jgi:hypothetical protein